MKNNKHTSSELFSFSIINTQDHIQNAHKLRAEAIANHFGVIKNVFKKKSTASILNKK